MHWFTNYSARRLEWSIAMYTLAFGIFLMLPGGSMVSPGFSLTLDLLNEQQWGMVYLVVGVVHSIALHINGRAAWTPFARLIVMILNSQAFLAMALSVWSVSPWSTGGFTYGFVAIGFCGPAIVSAAYDCGRELRIWRGKRGGI